MNVCVHSTSPFHSIVKLSWISNSPGLGAPGGKGKSKALIPRCRYRLLNCVWSGSGKSRRTGTKLTIGYHEQPDEHSNTPVSTTSSNRQGSIRSAVARPDASGERPTLCDSIRLSLSSLLQHGHRRDSNRRIFMSIFQIVVRSSLSQQALYLPQNDLAGGGERAPGRESFCVVASLRGCPIIGQAHRPAPTGDRTRSNQFPP